jgi:hypothetical protein
MSSVCRPRMQGDATEAGVRLVRRSHVTYSATARIASTKRSLAGSMRTASFPCLGAGLEAPPPLVIVLCADRDIAE